MHSHHYQAPPFVLTFLGTGTSQGVPMIGCYCPVCTSPDPRDRRTRTSVLIRTPHQQILIDTTPDLRFQALRENLAHVDAVLLTHAHTDHIMGFDDLRRFSELQQCAIPLYASVETMEKMKQIFGFVFEFSNSQKPPKGYLRIIPHLIEKTWSLREIEITPIPLVHGAMKTLGFVFSSKKEKLLAYYTDCQELSAEAIAAAQGARILVLDALRDQFHPTHLNFDQAIQAAHQIKAERTFFIHCSHEVSHAPREAQLPEGILIAYDGLKVILTH